MTWGGWCGASRSCEWFLPLLPRREETGVWTFLRRHPRGIKPQSLGLAPGVVSARQLGCSSRPPKAGASSPHSKRFAITNAPSYSRSVWSAASLLPLLNGERSGAGRRTFRVPWTRSWRAKAQGRSHSKTWRRFGRTRSASPTSFCCSDIQSLSLEPPALSGP